MVTRVVPGRNTDAAPVADVPPDDRNPGMGVEDRVEALTRQILATVARVLASEAGRGLVTQLAGESGTLDDREQWLVALQRRIMTAIGTVVLETERGYRGARARCACGRTGRYVRDDPKRYVTLVGEVEIRRAEYWCPACGAWRPLDAQWDLPEGHFTRNVVRLAAMVGSALPFSRAAEVLQELGGIGMSPSQVRIVCERVGEAIGKDQAAATEQALQGAVVPPEPPEVLVIGMDGAHLNTREEGWRETKVGVAARYEWREGERGWELRPVAAAYTALLGPPEPFGRMVYALAQQQGGRGRQCTLVLGDGAPWIWNQAAEHFPDAVQVLDYYHLAEHVFATARELFGEGDTTGRDWAETVLELLREEEIETALEYLKRTGDGTAKLREYIEANRRRMPYRWLRARGYPMGSGIVESACKQIVHTRHRQAGMRWCLKNAQRMLHLRCCIRSDSWDRFWATHPRVA